MMVMEVVEHNPSCTSNIAVKVILSRANPVKIIKSVMRDFSATMSHMARAPANPILVSVISRHYTLGISTTSLSVRQVTPVKHGKDQAGISAVAT